MTGLPEVNASFKESTKHEIVGESYELRVESVQEEIEDQDDLVMIINKYLDESDDGNDLIVFINTCKLLDPKIRFIVITGAYDRAVIQPLVNAGIFDVIIAEDGLSSNDLESRIDKPAKFFPFELYEKVVIEATKSTQPMKPASLGFSFFGQKQKIRTLMKETVVFWSPFSRGATTCAAHYAMALADKYNCQVAVVSLDMISPRLEPVMGLTGKARVQDALKNLAAGTLTTERLQKLMTESSKNVDILPSSYSYDELYYTDPRHVKRLLELIKGLYDFVVVDVNRYYIDKFTFTALEHADQVICPLRGVKEDLEQYNAYLKEFRGHGDFKIEKFRPLINQYATDHLSFIEVEQLLGEKPLGYISVGKVAKVMKKSMANLAEKR